MVPILQTLANCKQNTHFNSKRKRLVWPYYFISKLYECRVVLVYLLLVGTKLNWMLNKKLLILTQRWIRTITLLGVGCTLGMSMSAPSMPLLIWLQVSTREYFDFFIVWTGLGTAASHYFNPLIKLKEKFRGPTRTLMLAENNDTGT